MEAGIFEYTVVTNNGFQSGKTNRSSIIAMIEDARTDRVKLMVGGHCLKDYKRPGWAARVMKYMASGAVTVVFYATEKEAKHAQTTEF